jgi:hypothetical protein
MAAPTTYELGFKLANTFWKAPGVYFHMHQTTRPYHVRASRNHHFGGETFSANGAATPYFDPLGCVSCCVQFEHVLGLEHDPASMRSSSHTYMLQMRVEGHGDS